MWERNIFRISYRLSQVLLSVVLLLFGFRTIQAQSSTQNLASQEALWQSLLQTTQQLSSQYDNFIAKLNSETSLLSATNLSLQNSNQLLMVNNKSLMDSNTQLTIKNKSLQDSNSKLVSNNLQLMQSQVTLQTQAETLAKQLKQSQMDLQDSTQAIIQAQGQAKALELQLGSIRIGIIVVGAVAVGSVAYIFIRK